MPRYTLKLGGSKITSFETDESISKSVSRRLQGGEPQTWIDGGGTMDTSRFQSQTVDRDQLLEYKKVRENGGPVAAIIEAKALLTFGVECEFQAEEDDLSEWLNEEAFPDRNLLFTELGKDAYTYPSATAEAVETRGGDFSHVEFIEPWTMIPKTNNKGDVIRWEQTVNVDGQRKTMRVDPDDVLSVVLTRESGRDKTGVSLIERNRDEIERFMDNQDSIKNSAQLHGFPQRHVKVGREGGAVIDDNELRRVRQRFTGKINELTSWFTGRDVEIDTLEAENFDYDRLTENDLKILTLSFLLPQELANTGSDGLGSGMPAELRKSLLSQSIKAQQTDMSRQFIEGMVRDVVRQYSPYDPEQHISIEWDDPFESRSDRLNELKDMKEYLKPNEFREKAGLEPLEELEDEPVGPPGEEGIPDDEGGPFGGVLEDTELEDRQLETYDDYPEAAQENARMALDAREEHGNPNDCGTRVGWERANQLDNGESLSEETISRMAAFERHEDNKEQGEEGNKDCGWLMWKTWGGDEGIEWAQDKLDEIEGEEGNENRAASVDTSHFEDWEKQLYELERGVHDMEPDTRVLSYTGSETPEFVLERIREVIMSEGLFSQFDSIASGDRMQLREFFTETLGESNAWTIDGLADQIEQLGVDSDDARRIARTETHEILADARERGYEERGFEDSKYYWVGSTGDRTTDICKYLVGGFNTSLDHPGDFSGLDRPNGTNPFQGGEPMGLEELKQHVQNVSEASRQFDLKPREWTPHINCRKTFVRAPPE